MPECKSDSLACLGCSRSECVYEQHGGKAYRKRGLAVDQDKVDAWKKERPRCTICPKVATRYAWNDGERVIDPYCDDHRGYSEHGYYEGEKEFDDGIA